ncbi:hypothetical protein L1285_07185 [Pseudoalteromonas sp. DL2-H2.2]|uniref:hypothetical protein n=1 Tax=Pseudoalteromonas sp. DL2-H2.2 TaxID=2908889 RepID=UPI001F178D5E|nr:hypothetical protein [Pseudoalteromonas sp. DL2-H2.2]MCF2908106.1 hypothetical protein [Pseudoalteromonas sp. DL2-H2.2]
MLRTVFLGLFVLALMGCSSTSSNTKQYAQLQNSKLKDGDSSFSRMFDAVNGEKLKIGAFTTPNKALHFVAPGKSQLQIRVTYSNDLFSDVMVSDFIVVAELKKGEKYTIDSKLEGDCIKISVVNSVGELVAGPFTKQYLGYESAQRLTNMVLRQGFDMPSDKCTVQ